MTFAVHGSELLASKLNCGAIGLRCAAVSDPKNLSQFTLYSLTCDFPSNEEEFKLIRTNLLFLPLLNESNE